VDAGQQFFVVVAEVDLRFCCRSGKVHFVTCAML
jgi:hypothetical protein